MRNFLRFLSAALPFLAAEAIQYTVINFLLLSNMLELTQEVLYLYSVMAIIVCGIVFFFWYRNEMKGERRGNLKFIFKAKNLLLFALLGISCQLFFTGLMSLLTPYFSDTFSDYDEVINTITSGSDVLVLLLVVIIAPVTEELIFRGVILHMANRYIAFSGANMLQALLFGIYHGNIVQGIYAALLGLLLGIVYYKYRSIIASIILHMMINTSAFLIYLFPKSMVVYIGITAAGGIAFLVAIILVQSNKSMLSDSK